MLRQVIWAALLLTLGWLVRLVFQPSGGASGSGRRAPAGPSGAVPQQSEGLMVRDRICNTFLPKARALVVSAGDQQYFFCSERCRSAFLAQR